MSSPCDHEWYRDLMDRNEIFMTCFCYCKTCYDPALLVLEGNGCIDSECFCQSKPTGNCRAVTAAHIYDTGAEKLPQAGRKPVETVIKDLPENPGKTGTCRKCKAPTFRKGSSNRGRFPVLCEECK